VVPSFIWVHFHSALRSFAHPSHQLYQPTTSSTQQSSILQSSSIETKKEIKGKEKQPNRPVLCYIRAAPENFRE